MKNFKEKQKVFVINKPNKDYHSFGSICEGNYNGFNNQKNSHLVYLNGNDYISDNLIFGNKEEAEKMLVAFQQEYLDFISKKHEYTATYMSMLNTKIKKETEYTIMNDIVPCKHSRAIEFVLDELKARNMSISYFLWSRKISRWEWLKIRYFNYPMTELFCRKIDLGKIPYTFWLNMQNDYDLTKYCKENNLKKYSEVEI